MGEMLLRGIFMDRVSAISHRGYGKRTRTGNLILSQGKLIF